MDGSNVTRITSAGRIISGLAVDYNGKTLEGIRMYLAESKLSMFSKAKRSQTFIANHLHLLNT